MIDEIDEGLRELLIDELPISGDEIDISFDQPKREWSARLSRPTINLFLYDIREDQKMRTAVPFTLPTDDPMNRAARGYSTEEYAPLWVRLNYMITAWAADPTDEHRLLMRILLSLYRHPYLDNQYLRGEDLETLPQIKAAQFNVFQESDRIWSSLDNELRAAVSCVISLPVHPFQTFNTPIVRSLDMGFGQSFQPRSGSINVPDDSFWMVGGLVTSVEPFQSPRLVLDDLGLEIAVDPDGRFRIGRLQPGSYNVTFIDVDRESGPHIIDVPSDNYNLTV